ncbi:unnamed protein product [Prorocentrum cordatum]|uniref:J domain-containing protein n=1 Tax=Prorocentrum cordatum TaxID=2364126 RepID=A0ABN9VGJ9_9DINO|nr:unnamed protein product [Polarella glacialis]
MAWRPRQRGRIFPMLQGWQRAYSPASFLGGLSSAAVGDARPAPDGAADLADLARRTTARPGPQLRARDARLMLSKVGELQRKVKQHLAKVHGEFGPPSRLFAASPSKLPLAEEEQLNILTRDIAQSKLCFKARERGSVCNGIRAELASAHAAAHRAAPGLSLASNSRLKVAQGATRQFTDVAAEVGRRELSLQRQKRLAAAEAHGMAPLLAEPAGRLVKRLERRAACSRARADLGGAPGPDELRESVEKLPGIGMCGDEPWYDDQAFRRALHDKVVAAHAEQKIVVGTPAEEIPRIRPPDGRVLAAGGVLRLGGRRGGYGDADIGYAYRQLSRALHPDKCRGIPEAASAFTRLQEAADELRQTLERQRAILRAICEGMGGRVTPQMSERPQWALLAEVSRMLSGVLGLCGEGSVPSHTQVRGAAVFTACARYHGCEPAALLAMWFEGGDLLESVGSSAVRGCLRPDLRAALLCALYRATIAEDKRLGGLRGTWQAVFTQFPELGLWKELRDKARLRSTDSRRWDSASDFQPSEWARPWRSKIREVLTTCTDGVLPAQDPKVRALAGDLWQDLAEWAAAQGLQRSLELFTAAPEGSEATVRFGAPPVAPDAWCYVPAADVLLIVGEGMVGITAEGVFLEELHRVAAAPSTEAAQEDAAGPAPEEGEPKKKLSAKEEQKLAQGENFDWEKLWRQKSQASQIRKTTRAGWQRGNSPSRRRRSSSSSPSSRRRRKGRNRSRSRSPRRRPSVPSRPQLWSMAC